MSECWEHLIFVVAHPYRIPLVKRCPQGVLVTEFLKELQHHNPEAIITSLYLTILGPDLAVEARCVKEMESMLS